MPHFISPQLATLVDKPPEGQQWIHEIKYDGYRILAFINGNEIVLKSRNNKTWTLALMPIVHALKESGIQNAILDGEVVLLNDKGITDFQLLQNSIKSNQKDMPFIYYIFDILYLDAYDLREFSLIERKNILKKLLIDVSPCLRFSEHFTEDANEVFEKACDLELEGMISKDRVSTYVSRRSRSWLKIKCLKRQEFVVGGYSPPKGGRSHFGSLYVGVFNEADQLEYAGNVGTGFSSKSLQEVFVAIEKYKTSTNPFNSKPPLSKHATWVKPVLVAEVEFTEWTKDGHLRHPSFKGLRLDKKAELVVREQTLSVKKIVQNHSKAKGKPVIKLTNPDKILYPEDKLTKQDLLAYYEQVASFILPFIKNRPLSLVRCPNSYKTCFFQRHFNKTTPKTLHPIPIEDKEQKRLDYIYLNDTQGLFSLVQMGVLEIHPWGSRISHVHEPDILIMDLDPAPDVAWKDVVKGALIVKEQLENYQLTSFVKSTGGKGLHVVIPIKPEYDWTAIKEFTHVFVKFLEQLKPDHFVSTMTKTKRTGKIFVDYLRNQQGATAVSAYSTRARIHAPISVPLSWDELSSDRRDTSFTIKTISNRLDSLKQDPWQDFWTMNQSLRLNQL